MTREEINSSWEKNWVNNKTLWHLNFVNPFLQKYFHMLSIEAGKRIIVPLCGKTMDLIWLYQQGLVVVGVEFASIPCTRFFEDNFLSYTIENHGSYNVYKHDERLIIYQGDLFEFDVQNLGGYFDFWWDRGGLVAMVVKEQQKYVDHLRSLMHQSKFSALMESYEYDSSLRAGAPPQSINKKQLQDLFTDSVKLEELDRVSEDDLPENYTAKLGCSSTLVFYLITLN
ncbi:thiopurine S-methyltransferase [Hydra vulgaris]|uniref:thiopurine S-methyltransferase n=1 Tax=Hydra vulgaris TaxID=6087 RepID=UPI001F5FC191|nr:thiopurine S-methyltransferase [Hydra vulgaris]